MATAKYDETTFATGEKKFSIDKEKCITCAACWEAFPDTFVELAGKAAGMPDQPMGKHAPADVTAVCPTDAILYGGTSPREGGAKATGKFSVVEANCIDCTACYRDFPKIFEEKDGVAVAKEDQDPESNHPLAVVLCCPTNAIQYSAKMPDMVGKDGLLQEKEGWEAEWTKMAQYVDPVDERDRRYGKKYTVVENEAEGHTLITIEFPQKVPNVRDRYRFGLTEKMPRYTTKTTLENNSLLVRGWLTEAKIRAAISFGRSFPDRFSVQVDLPKETYGFAERYDGHNVMRIAVFTDPLAPKNFKWDAHFITDKCVGCTICERVCPTKAITGDRNEIYFIDPKLCINCSVCGVYCPYDAIDDHEDDLVQRIKAKEIPKAEVIEDLCTGCEFCVDVCPFDCIHMELADDGFNRIAVVEEKPCVSCKLCEQVCIKGAIVVDRAQEFTPDIGWSYQEGSTSTPLIHEKEES